MWTLAVDKDFRQKFCVCLFFLPPLDGMPSYFLCLLVPNY